MIGKAFKELFRDVETGDKKKLLYLGLSESVLRGIK